jgi:hypothetical protein
LRMVVREGSMRDRDKKRARWKAVKRKNDGSDRGRVRQEKIVQALRYVAEDRWVLDPRLGA